MDVMGDWRDYKEQVKRATDIIEVASRYMTLKRTGKTFKAVCPFHREKTPSFHIDPQKQSWHCYGACAEGGDVLDFLMKMEGTDFRETLVFAGERLGIPKPKSMYSSPEDGIKEDRKKGVLAALEKACEFYESNLSGSESEHYLSGKRGIKPETVKAFRLGHARQANELIYFLRDSGFNMQVMHDASLVGLRDGGKSGSESPGDYYDFLRGRVIFPIIDTRGRVISFAGRSLPSGNPDAPKYMNGRETEVFKKSNVFYGLDTEIFKLVREKGYVAVVEGYVDVVRGRQEGFPIIAVAGSAFTREHANILARRFSDANKILCFDGDEAGQEAAAKAVAVSLSRVPTSICLLPESLDPADLLEAGRNADLEERLKSTQSSFDFYIGFQSQGLNLRGWEHRGEFIRRIKNALKDVPEDFQGICVETLANKTGITPNQLMPNIFGKPYKEMRAERSIKWETELLRQILALNSPEVVNYVAKRLSPAEFTDSRARELFVYVTKHPESASSLFHEASTPLFKKSADEILRGIEMAPESFEPYLRELMANLPEKHSQREVESALLRVKAASLATELTKAFHSGTSLEKILKVVEEVKRKLE